MAQSLRQFFLMNFVNISSVLQLQQINRKLILDSYRLVVVRLVFLWGEELGLEFVGVSSTDHILSYGSCCGFCGGCFLSCSFSCCCLSGGGFLCCCFCCGCFPCCGLLCRSFRCGFLFGWFFSSFLSCFCLYFCRLFCHFYLCNFLFCLCCFLCIFISDIWI